MPARLVESAQRIFHIAKGTIDNELSRRQISRALEEIASDLLSKADDYRPRREKTARQ